MDDPLNGLSGDVIVLLLSFIMVSLGMWGVVLQTLRILKKLWP